MTALTRSALCLVLAALAGCTQRTGGALGDRQNDPHLLVDHQTGCEYLSAPGSSGIVPRVGADGKTHMGCKGAKP
jgi:hypothetical protein